MRLYLVRHGKAVHEQLDPQRPLSQEGRDEVKEMAQFIKALRLNLAEVFHSTKLRARETAVLIKDAALPQAEIVEKEGLCPNDNVDNFMKALQGRRQDLMVVGHLPFLPCLASLLTVDEERTFFAMPPGSMVMLESAEGRVWYVTGFLTPDMIGSKEYL